MGKLLFVLSLAICRLTWGQDTTVSFVHGEYQGVPYQVTNFRVDAETAFQLLEKAEAPIGKEAINLVSVNEDAPAERLRRFEGLKTNLKTFFMAIPSTLRFADEKVQRIIEGDLKNPPKPNRLDVIVSSIIIGNYAINWLLYADVATATQYSMFIANSLMVYLFTYQKTGLALMEKVSRAANALARDGSPLAKYRGTATFDMVTKLTHNYILSFVINTGFEALYHAQAFPIKAQDGMFWFEVAVKAAVANLAGGVWASVISRWRYSENPPISKRSVNILYHSLKVVRAVFYPFLYQGGSLFPLTWGSKTMALAGLGVVATAGIITALKGDAFLIGLKESRLAEKFYRSGEQLSRLYHQARERSFPRRKVYSCERAVGF